MFTGIITFQLKVLKITPDGQLIRITTTRPQGKKISQGDSISLSGICTTVTKVTNSSLDFDFMPETVRKTTVKNWKTGMRINGEDSLRPSTALNGHFVMGHIDGVCRVVKIQKEGESKIIWVKHSKAHRDLLAPKGCVAIDGVSLTVVKKTQVAFTVALIPYTLKHTSLGSLKVGNPVNVEFDMFAKYIKEILSSQRSSRYAKK